MKSIYDYYMENHYQKRSMVRSNLDEGNRLFYWFKRNES